MSALEEQIIWAAAARAYHEMHHDYTQEGAPDGWWETIPEEVRRAREQAVRAEFEEDRKRAPHLFKPDGSMFTSKELMDRVRLKSRFPIPLSELPGGQQPSDGVALVNGQTFVTRGGQLYGPMP